MRILITGSRTWHHAPSIRHVIDRAISEAIQLGETLTVVHGGAAGADLIANDITRDYQTQGWPVAAEEHPAAWGVYGRRAGMIRNQAMVNLGADLAAAFIRDNSAGVTACAQMAERAGIPVVIVRWEDRDDAASSFPAATERTTP